MGVDLSGKRVVVTGGTGALGTEVVRLALEAGAQVWVPVHSASELEGWEFQGHDRVTVKDGVDLTDEGEVATFYTAAHGGSAVWASIHTVGGFAAGMIGKTDRALFDRMIQTNLTSCYLCCRECARAMRGAGKGRIVNVTARVALVPGSGAGMTAYAVSKAGVAALTVALSAEMAGAGVLVNAVAPSVMDTPANRKNMPKADYSKWPTPGEVARQILWLISEENSAVRGAIVPVYGAKSEE